ncbi:hypothetical protein Pan181_36480 [Aeoliella mucimassa]|uniref:Lnb N-terminal periplasmic domain-containing protein n=2 Tax=Aeoliella mucimassa TaxID=2527972 RepID=A0A518ART9_9BACT|nr:hypothetical protein Pan181_36480 [Aeoliella mucimassa]
MVGGCKSAEKMVAPSQYRNWQPQYSLLPTAEFHGSQVTIRNVRYCKYLDGDTYVPNWYDKKIDVRNIRAVDFVLMPFPDVPALAHTQVSFEIAPPGETPQYLVVSAEVRKEVGEEYGPIKGSARQFELAYVVADERDSLLSQTNYRDRDVYLYRSTATAEQAQRMFVDMMARVNGLATRPEFYDTLTNNCTTNIVDHINRVQPQRLTYDYRVLLPGLSDKLAYDQGLIERHGTFEQTKSQAYLNPRTALYDGKTDFSTFIRR